eukprot:GEMP01055254.1.p1 GENE.GEMP01055254.1~~GEMP01055254.1.p1  ORF type:complete len:390 (+),score=105.92 GEMP01055254.1:40-1170(+)
MDEDDRNDNTIKHGTIKFFDHKRHFGFIHREGEKDIFVAARSCTGCVSAGTRVAFTLSDDGEASDVVVIPNSSTLRHAVTVDDTTSADLRAVVDKLDGDFLAALHDAYAIVEKCSADSIHECFEVVNVVLRHYVPRVDFPHTAAVLTWLRRLSWLNIAWTTKQRQQLREAENNFRALMGDDDSNAISNVTPRMSVDKMDGVLQARTRYIVVCLEGLRTPTNIGMIYRTMEGMGIQEVWLLPARKKIKMHGKVRSASRQCEQWLTIRRFASVAEVRAACAAEGRQLWVTNVGQSTTSVYAVRPPIPKMCLVMGTEGEGATAEMCAAADAQVTLPMRGFVESFNVAIATALFLQVLVGLSGEHGLSQDEEQALRDKWR